jgi:type I restriction enzyme R subunit
MNRFAFFLGNPDIGLATNPDAFAESDFRLTPESIAKIKNRRYAVIVDEAHSSQSGKLAEAMHRVLGLPSEKKADEEYTLEDAILESALARGRQSNISMYAFTATPKDKTLEKFGRKREDGKFEAHHLYSMKQAIEEGFILDILKNYTTYQMYYQLEKKIADDPALKKTKGLKALARWATLHPHNISQKTELIIEHFRSKIMHKLGGRAKAMVVTGSRENAVRYKLSFDSYIKDKGYTDIKTLVAFSGTKIVDGDEYTEAKMNGFSETELPEKFESDDYQVLLVAEKYQTGFDQPLLVAMYVDKKLAGLQAVQTLSRLNRVFPGKEDTFILDFENDVDTIVEAFKPYYESTELQHETDPNLLYEAKNKLDGFGVCWPDDIDAFAEVFWKNTESLTARQKEDCKGLLHSTIDPSVSRFKELDEEQQEVFRHVLQVFLRLYGFLSQIIDFQDIDLEKLSAYGRFLAAKLPRRPSERVDFNDEIVLESYRLEKVFEGHIQLAAAPDITGIEHIGDGRKMAEKLAPLSELIHRLNEKCGGKLSENDRIYFEQLATDMVSDDKIVQQAQANNDESQFRLGFDKKFIAAMIGREEQNRLIAELILSNEDARSMVCDIMAKEVIGRIREEKFSMDN